MLMKICRRMSGVNDVFKTSLYDFHIKNKGKMVEFTNYMMPI
jgi:glycine cleavage system aminomethyltransferase T